MIVRRDRVVDADIGVGLQERLQTRHDIPVTGNLMHPLGPPSQ